MVRYTVLGQVRAWDGARELPIGHARQRCLLAILLLETNSVVPVPRLTDLLWDGRPPRSARNVIAGYATRLRRALTTDVAQGEGSALLSRDGGYVLEADPRSLDLHRFRQLRARAQRAEDPRISAELLQHALDLWTGPPLGDVGGGGLDPVRTALEQERCTAWLDWCDAQFRLGRHGVVIPRLVALADADPLDEQLALRLMIALAEAGNQAAAAERYERSCKALAEELGVGPSEELTAAAERIGVTGRCPSREVSRAAQPPAEPRTPAGLPARPEHVVGRTAELRYLDEHAGEARVGAANLMVVAGRHGIGKTALVLRWAHEAARRFPDCLLFVNLRGSAPYLPPVTPAEALGQCLYALGVPSRDVPFGLDLSAAVYRTLLAERRCLIILDDAADDEQVERLVPPRGSDSVVVVTCRRPLGRLVARYGAQQLKLDVLAEETAVDYLLDRIGPRGITRNAATRLAHACGFVPLALSTVAGDLNHALP